MRQFFQGLAFVTLKALELVVACYNSRLQLNTSSAEIDIFLSLFLHCSIRQLNYYICRVIYIWFPCAVCTLKRQIIWKILRRGMLNIKFWILPLIRWGAFSKRSLIAIMKPVVEGHCRRFIHSLFTNGFFQFSFPFHSSILKPYFNLCFSKSQIRCYFNAPCPC